MIRGQTLNTKHFKRLAQVTIERLSRFPSLTILGPRQSGKSTLAKIAFPNHTFISFDQRREKIFAQEDPELFFRAHDNNYGIILDEFQYVPEILDQVKYLIDKKVKPPGYFVLTGSENYLTNRKITESLAGRTALIKLLPLSIEEMKINNLIDPSTHVDEVIFKGGYPRIYDEAIPAKDYYLNYAQTFLEKDVTRKVKSDNLDTFTRFFAMCAGRVGKVLNITSIGDNLGITDITVKQWLKILMDNFVIFMHPAFSKNLDGRLTKKPKLYFYDTGLVCEQLGITNAKDVYKHHQYGYLFENLIVSDMYKQYLNNGAKPQLSFWKIRKHEVDCVLSESLRDIPIEIKAAGTFDTAFFKGLKMFNKSTNTDEDWNYIVYGGQETLQRRSGTIFGWQTAGTLVDTINQRIKEDDNLRYP